MPKMKSSKSARKRFKLTASGKVKYKKRNRRHILTKKAPKRKRHLRKTSYLAGGDAKNMTQLIDV